MAAINGESGIVKVQLCHLIGAAGAADEAYESSADDLMQALRNDHVCIIKLDEAEAHILKYGLGYATSAFGSEWSQGRKRQRDPGPVSESEGGYQSLPEKEMFNAVLGGRPHQPILVKSFKMLSHASRSILTALAWGLRVHTSSFDSLLDSEPLLPGATSASVLSCFHYKERLSKGGQGKAIQSACPEHVDKGLMTLIASDDPQLEVLSHNQWKIVPAKLADNEIILLSGQALFEATGGHIEAAHHRVVEDEGRARFSLAFKCRPQQQAVFDRGPIADANPTVARKYRKTERLLPVAKYMADFDTCHASVNKAGTERFLHDAVRESTDASNSTASNQKRKEGRINVTLHDQSGCDILIKCRPSVQVQVLRDAYLARDTSLVPESIVFLLGGCRMELWETLTECKVEDGDIIDVMLLQRGD